MDDFNANKIGYDLVSVANFFRNRITAIQSKAYPSKKSASNGYIISYLCENEGKDIYQKDIEREFDIGRSSVSSMLNELEKCNLIERKKVAVDSRLNKIIVTEAGKLINDACKREVNHFFYDLASDLSENDVRTFLMVIDIMKKNKERIIEKEENSIF